MADVIKIPFGYVVALSSIEWAIISAAIKTMIEMFSASTITDTDNVTIEQLEQLLADLLTPKSSFGNNTKVQ